MSELFHACAQKAILCLTGCNEYQEYIGFLMEFKKPFLHDSSDKDDTSGYSVDEEFKVDDTSNLE